MRERKNERRAVGGVIKIKRKDDKMKRKDNERCVDLDTEPLAFLTF